jgi:hypothetical protein
MENRLAEETEVLGENLPQRHFCPSQNPTWPYPGLNSGRRGGKPATTRLSHGAALPMSYYASKCNSKGRYILFLAVSVLSWNFCTVDAIPSVRILIFTFLITTA